MYVAVRYILGFSLLGAVISSLRRGWLKGKRKLRVLVFLLAFTSIFWLAMIPFENLFVTFSTPDELFDYYGNSTERRYIVGEESLMMVYVDKDGIRSFEMARKAKQGWKIVALPGIRRVYGHSYDGIVVNIFHCARTKDYYVRVGDTIGNVQEITDNRGTMLWHEGATRKNVSGWSGYVIHFDETYAINVNGNWIPVGRDYVDSKTADPTYKVGNNFQSVG